MLTQGGPIYGWPSMSHEHVVAMTIGLADYVAVKSLVYFSWWHVP
jgi:hypothetical protein